MRKVIKILFSVLSGLILALITIPILVGLLLNVKTIQNFAVHTAGERISQAIGTRVSIDRISIRGFSKLQAEGVFVQDIAGDTLIYAQTLTGRLSRTAILRRNVIIGDITLDGGKIYLFKPAEGPINIQQVLNTFLDRDREKKGNSTLTLRDIYITNSRFKYQKEGADTLSPGRMNYSNMVFDSLTLGCHKLLINGGRLSMNLYDMRFTDISGFKIENMEVEQFVLDNGLLDLEDARIVTPDSKLILPQIKLNSGDWKTWQDFVYTVRLDVKMRKSEVSSETVSYFVPGLRNSNVVLKNTTLDFGGPVNNFAGTITNAATGNTRFNGTYSVRNVTDFKNAVFRVNIPKFASQGGDVSKLISDIAGVELGERTDRMLDKAGSIDASFSVNGSMKDFVTDVSLNTGIGSLTLAGNVTMPEEKSVRLDGKLDVADLMAGALTDIPRLGSTSFGGQVNGGLKNGRLDGGVDITVSHVVFDGNRYEDIRLRTQMTDDIVDAKINAFDPGLRFMLAGKANLRNEIPSVDADLNVLRADLVKLGVNKRDEKAVLSGNFVIKGSGSKLDNINGVASIDTLVYQSSADSLYTGRITLTGKNSPEMKSLSLSSPFADIDYQSELGYDEVLQYMQHILYDYLPALSGVREEHNPFYYREYSGYGLSTLIVDVKETSNVAAIIMPGLSVAENTSAKIAFNPRTEKFSLRAASDYIEYNDFFVTKLDLTGDNAGDSLSLAFGTSDLFVSGMRVPATNIKAQAKANHIDLSSNLSDQSATVRASLRLGVVLARNDGGMLSMEGSFGPSNLTVGQRVWNISDRGLSYRKGRAEIRDFRIAHEQQSLYVSGTLSANRSDTLHVRLNDMDLSILSYIAGDTGYDIEGLVNGFADISSAMEKQLVVADITLDSLRVNAHDVVPLHLTSRWDSAAERASVFLTGRDSGHNYVRGFYRPTDSAFLLDIDVPALDLSFIEPLLSGAVTNTSGTAAVRADIRRSSGQPVMNGTVKIADLSTKVAFNNATYTIRQAVIDIDHSVATMQQTLLFDSENNSAVLNASANLTSLANIRYSANLRPQNIIALNTSIRDNDAFYGKVFASGSIGVRGERGSVDVNIVATTENNSAFSMPLGGKSSVSVADFITFQSKAAEEVDELTRKKMMYERRMNGNDDTRSRVNISMTLNVLPNTLVNLVIDQESNNMINARGNGRLNIQINPQDSRFNIVGNYEITEGDFILNLQNIVSNRRFTIQPGGTIQWTGDPVDAALNVTAIYRLQASMSGLRYDMADIASGLGRVPIECIINIHGRLSQPEITFGINAPNADADIQNRLAALFSTQEMLARNFLWLVAFNSFFPEEGGSNMDIGSMGTSVGLEFITSQISNLISSDKADFIFRIRPQGEMSSSEVDFGISTDIITGRLFLEVEGNVDTGDNPNAVRTQNPMTGNASITAVLNRSGTISMKLFTRSIDRISRTTNADLVVDETLGLQESGLGIYYKKDFNRFSDIIDQMRSRSEKRRERRKERHPADNGEQTVPESAATDNSDGIK